MKYLQFLQIKNPLDNRLICSQYEMFFAFKDYLAQYEFDKVSNQLLLKMSKSMNGVRMDLFTELK